MQEKDFWKSELKEFSSKNGYDLNRNGDSPVLLDVLEGFLKFEVFHLVALITPLFNSLLPCRFLSELSRLYCIVLMMDFGLFSNGINVAYTAVLFCLLGVETIVEKMVKNRLSLCLEF